MSLNVELLEQSFASVASRGNELVDAFYRNLFIDFPSVRPMFENTSMAEQKQKLHASLKLIVENLRRPDQLVPALEQMGERHASYGAEEAHYPAVGATLLKSLAEIAGDHWTSELTDAWADAYYEVTRHMLNGANLAIA